MCSLRGRSRVKSFSIFERWKSWKENKFHRNVNKNTHMHTNNEKAQKRTSATEPTSHRSSSFVLRLYPPHGSNPIKGPTFVFLLYLSILKCYILRFNSWIKRDVEIFRKLQRSSTPLTKLERKHCSYFLAWQKYMLRILISLAQILLF